MARLNDSVVFVVPFFAETSLRFLAAATQLDGVRVALISQDPLERLPRNLARKLADHQRVADGLDPEQLSAAVAAIAQRLAPPRRLIGALEQLQVPLAQVREKLDIPGMRSAAARNFRDKSRMKRVLREAGLPCARHCLLHAPQGARAFAEEVGFPLVAKPPEGVAARQTFRLEDLTQLEQCLQAVPPSRERPLMLEEFIVGEEHSFDTVSLEGRPLWHSLTRYRPGPLEVLENPWIQWTVLLPREVDHPQYDDIRRVGFGALQALGMDTGLSHMEWFRRGDGSVAVSEVGARPPGAQFTTLISYAHEVDFYAAWARLMVLQEFEPPPRRFAAGIAYLRGQGRGRVRAVHGLEQAQKELGELVVEVRLPQPGQAPASSYEGEGFVVLRHSRTSIVAEALARVVSLVRVELG